MSTLVFVEDLALKRKKPVRTAFLDLSSTERRREACASEVALNRRLAPDVYLGVGEVTCAEAGIHEPLVVMRRLPAGRSLEAMASANADLDGALREIARRLAAFHAWAHRGPEMDRAAAPEAVAALWRSNLAQLAARSDLGDPERADLHRIGELATAYLAGRSRLIEHRIAAGRACDGHGDLQAADIFLLDDGPRILDCLEFDPALRWGDALADVAFLAMDLERLGRPLESARFLDRYADLSGDRWPPSLAHHWVAYRALVRAKVALLRGRPVAGEPHRLLSLCRRHLEDGAVRLVLVGGLPGTGKSTLAEGLADRTGWPLLSSDDLRHEGGRVAEPGTGWEQGLYTPERTADTYAELLRRAGTSLSSGHSVILDASWTAAPWRRRAVSLARRWSARLVALECRAPQPVAERRIRYRRAAGATGSDATPPIARTMAAASGPWEGAVAIDTGRPPAEALGDALGLVHPTWAVDRFRPGSGG